MAKHFLKKFMKPQGFVETSNRMLKTVTGVEKKIAMCFSRKKIKLAKKKMVLRSSVTCNMYRKKKDRITFLKFTVVSRGLKKYLYIFR